MPSGTIRTKKIQRSYGAAAPVVVQLIANDTNVGAIDCQRAGALCGVRAIGTTVVNRVS